MGEHYPFEKFFIGNISMHITRIKRKGKKERKKISLILYGTRAT